MGFFDDISNLVTSPIRSVVRLTASVVATALSIPIVLAQEAIDAGCQSYQEVRDYIRENG